MILWLDQWIVYCIVQSLFHFVHPFASCVLPKFAIFHLFKSVFRQNLVLDRFNVMFEVFSCVHFMSFLICSSSWFWCGFIVAMCVLCFASFYVHEEKFRQHFALFFSSLWGSFYHFIILFLFYLFYLLFHFTLIMMVYVSPFVVLCG